MPKKLQNKPKKTLKKSPGVPEQRVSPVKTRPSSDQSLFEKLKLDLARNQSYLNLILGSLIVIVLGILLFNYFNKPEGNLGPSDNTQTQRLGEDVLKENLPGNYTVKEGDTLFSIAQNYYDDGYKYSQIAKANKLADENTITSGQVLMIPKLNGSSAQPSTSPETSPSPLETAAPAENTGDTQPAKGGVGGATNETIWGEKITGNTYTVQPGDWLSKIAGRAYGDVFQFDKIAKTNNIPDPNLIEPGTILKIPR